jgi:capsid portal protein
MYVKNVSQQDVLNAHRFPPGLAGIIPVNTAGIGDPAKYDEVYFKNETKPLIRKMVNAAEQDPEVGSKLGLEFNLG